MQGLLANRPAANAVAAETRYFATDANTGLGLEYVSDGTAWQTPFPSAASVGVAPAWTATTGYAAGAIVTYGGMLWAALTAHTSGASFTPTSWAAADLMAGHSIATGEETIPRWLVTNNGLAIGTSALRLTFFTARKTETVNTIKTFTGGTAAGATPTLCRMGIYTVNTDGSFTLAGACANDTTLFAAAGTAYSRALTTPFVKQAGQRYAFAPLVVTGFTVPTFTGFTTQNGAALGMEAPIMFATIGGQTDLPATIASNAIGGSGTGMIYGEITP